MAEHSADEPSESASGKDRPRHRRRVTTDAPPGSDPTPEKEQPRHAVTENDDRLRRDKPPHWR